MKDVQDLKDLTKHDVQPISDEETTLRNNRVGIVLDNIATEWIWEWGSCCGMGRLTEVGIQTVLAT